MIEMQRVCRESFLSTTQDACQTQCLNVKKNAEQLSQVKLEFVAVRFSSQTFWSATFAT
jgi:hypothetical protein